MRSHVAGGLFTSEDAGLTWHVPQDGPATVPVDELFVMGTDLVAATHGRGVWRATLSTTSVPGAPTLSSATAGNNTVALAWSAPVSDGGSAITGYRVYRGTSTGSETLLTTLGLVTTYNDTSAVNNTTYFYKLTALNGVGEGGLSNERSATPAAPPPTLGAPSNLTATAASRSQIGLTWTDNATTETGFKVERSWNGSTDWHQIGTVAANVTTYAHARQRVQATFYYRVRATNGSGDSAYSNVASATTLG